MPDISMCSNKECPLREGCYRFLATPSEYWQSYCRFEPNKSGECTMYWPVNNRRGVDEKGLQKDTAISA